MPDILRGKICNHARVSGFLQGHGEPPLCIGSVCSQYYGCVFENINYRSEIRKAEKMALTRGIIAEMEKEAGEK